MSRKEKFFDFMGMYKVFIIGVFIAFAFMAAMIAFNFSAQASWQASLAKQEATIADLANQLSNASDLNEGVRRQAVRMVTGTDTLRVAKDRVVAEDLIRQVTSWSTYDEYEAARQLLTLDYGMKEDGQFLSRYMPFVLNTELNGINYNHIDTKGLNSLYEGMTQYLINVDGNDYTYSTLVEWSARNSVGSMGTAVSLFEYTITVDGVLYNLSAFTLAR